MASQKCVHNLYNKKSRAVGLSLRNGATDGKRFLYYFIFCWFVLRSTRLNKYNERDQNFKDLILIYCDHLCS